MSLSYINLQGSSKAFPHFFKVRLSKLLTIYRYIFINAITSHRSQVVVAEWLRRMPRNQLGSGRAGSNPADDAFCYFCFNNIDKYSSQEYIV